MVKNNNQNRGSEEVMKTYQTIEKALADFREITRNPVYAQFLSGEQVYDLFILFIDSLRHVRKSQNSIRFWPKLNKGMREVPPSYANVGGLIPIKIRDNPEIYFSQEERSFLADVQIRLILAKDALLDHDLLAFNNLQYHCNECGHHQVKPRSVRLQELDRVQSRKNAQRRVRKRYGR